MKEENTDNLTEVYKILLEQEISNHNIFITVLLGIVVILLGATWWWNKSGANKEIKEEVEKKFEKEKKRILKKLEEEINVKINEKVKNYENKIFLVEADVARSMAISAGKEELYSHSIFWWANYLNCSIKINDSDGIRRGIKLIIDDLKLLKKTDDEEKIKPVYQYKHIEKIIEKIPKILLMEKKEILKLCEGREIYE